LRRRLISMLLELEGLRSAAGVPNIAPSIAPTMENEATFDDPESSATAETATNPTTPNATVERQLIGLPSNGNVSLQYAPLEIQHRTTQAKLHLECIRDIIAEKSFHYSHLVRNTRKRIQTRSQKRIKSLHNTLVLHARIYSRCRSRLISLNCDAALLRRFRLLTRDDIKTSTAILQPNTPGSTSLRLPWIWHNARYFLMTDDGGIEGEGDGVGVGESDPATMLECKKIIFFLFFQSPNISDLFVTVKRVHWLRARAQKNRWHEEKLLLPYEMQWTVRFFLNERKKWDVGVHSQDASPGAIAYSRRQRERWNKMALNSDKIFTSVSHVYESPV
jgi:hypothetical protein